jgi:hypothetical protein
MSARIVYALAAISASAAPTVAFEVAFDFSNVRACAGGTLRITPSPEFRLTDVPAGTVTLDFTLRDLTIDLAHGGRKLAYEGQAAIPADSFKYVGPCPVKGTHTYEWTVRALDSADGELGTATAQGDFTASRP